MMKIKLNHENLNLLIGNIKETLYDSSKEKEIKGDIIYYELISKIILIEILRENNIKYKIYILNKFLLEDERLFIQSNLILKLILKDFVSTNTDYFQYSFFKLSNPDLKVLEKKTNNDWIKETLINIFEQISLKYIQNLIDENERHKIKNRKNILIYLKSYFEKCLKIIEISFINIKQEKIKVLSNNNLIKLFSISFIRVYLKVFIDWINKNKLTKSIEIEEIIKAINGKKDNNFRDIIKCFIYKIIYNNNKQDISKLFEQDTINKYHLNSYSNFDLLQKEKNS